MQAKEILGTVKPLDRSGRQVRLMVRVDQMIRAVAAGLHFHAWKVNQVDFKEFAPVASNILAHIHARNFKAALAGAIFIHRQPKHAGLARALLHPAGNSGQIGAAGADIAAQLIEVDAIAAAICIGIAVGIIDP